MNNKLVAIIKNVVCSQIALSLPFVLGNLLFDPLDKNYSLGVIFKEFSREFIYIFPFAFVTGTFLGLLRSGQSSQEINCSSTLGLWGMFISLSVLLSVVTPIIDGLLWMTPTVKTAIMNNPLIAIPIAILMACVFIFYMCIYVSAIQNSFLVIWNFISAPFKSSKTPKSISLEEYEQIEKLGELKAEKRLQRAEQEYKEKEEFKRLWWKAYRRFSELSYEEKYRLSEEQMIYNAEDYANKTIGYY